MKSIKDFTSGMGQKRNYFDTHPDHKEYLEEAIEFVVPGSDALLPFAGAKWLIEEVGIELSDTYLRGLIRDGINKRIHK